MTEPAASIRVKEQWRTWDCMRCGEPCYQLQVFGIWHPLVCVRCVNEALGRGRLETHPPEPAR